ncbi:hypothetical protein CCH79_00011848, partial [Gambusia affinis]
MKDLCSEITMLLGSRSKVYDNAFTGFLFASAAIVIISSYVGVIIAARSASTGKASALKARNTLVLHLVQLCLSLSSTIYNPMLIALIKIVQTVVFIRLHKFLYVLIILFPKCLSSLIYGLRDQTIRPILLTHLGCQLKPKIVSSHPNFSNSPPENTNLESYLIKYLPVHQHDFQLWNNLMEIQKDFQWSNISAELQYQEFLERVITFTLCTIPSCVFLFINGTMLFTLRSKFVFRDTCRYILLFNLLIADTAQLAVWIGDLEEEWVPAGCGDWPRTPSLCLPLLNSSRLAVAAISKHLVELHIPRQFIRRSGPVCVVVFPVLTLLPVCRRAEVTLDGVWPNDKTTCAQIRSPERLADMNYEGRLEKASRKQGARFLEYRPETGSWVFEVGLVPSITVSHFSKYGLQDSDEDDDVPPKTDPKKLKTMMSLPASRLQQLLPPSQQQVAPQAQSSGVFWSVPTAAYRIRTVSESD